MQLYDAFPICVDGLQGTGDGAQERLLTGIAVQSLTHQGPPHSEPGSRALVGAAILSQAH